MPYSCKLQTTLSNFEVNDSYRDVEDPYVIVKFKSIDGFNVLVYTTTPWTLPANSGICLNAKEEYSLVEYSNETYLLATKLVDKIMGTRPYKLLSTHLGSFFEGSKYRSLFDDSEYSIVTDDYVTVTDGTGAVHLAPMFGEDDYRVGKKYQLAMIDHLDAEGKFSISLNSYQGLFCKDLDNKIIQDLKNNNCVFKYGVVKHSYPFCSRTNTPLIYRAVDAWYLKLEDIKDRLLQHNSTINWIPNSIGSGRFANWLKEAKDWNISRNRLWGSCLPIWQSEDGDIVCVASIQELEALSGISITDLHKDVLDKISFSLSGKVYKRVPEVLDCWFESGCMPYAQHHYPFENKELVEKNFPADFIVEGLDQTRGWFYTLLVLSTLLFDRAPFENVIVNGMILAEDGTKMSKSKGNYTDVNVLLAKYGADSLRSYLCSSSALYAEPLFFKEKDLVAASRSTIVPFTNALEFYKLYSGIDNWKDDGSDWKPVRLLDSWILTKFNKLLRETISHMENYDLSKVLPKTSIFLDDLCNWYIRSSRKLFWEKEISTKKNSAYKTLNYILTNLAKMLAPFLPFVSEFVYQELGYTGSIHWENYPNVSPKMEEERSLVEMEELRTLATLGHNLRGKNLLKVKQPLSKMVVYGAPLLSEEGKILLSEELNIKEISVSTDSYVASSSLSAKANFRLLGKRCGKDMQAVASGIEKLSSQEIKELQKTPKEIAGYLIGSNEVVITETITSLLPTETEGKYSISIDTTLTPSLLEEGDFREILSFLQNLRKDQGLEVTDKISVMYCGAEESKSCILNYLEELKSHLLAEDFFLKEGLNSNELNISSGKLYFEIKKYSAAEN